MTEKLYGLTVRQRVTSAILGGALGISACVTAKKVDLSFSATPIITPPVEVVGPTAAFTTEPTVVPTPTNEPIPTHELIPGIDTYIDAGDTRLKFTSVKISDSYYDPVRDKSYEIHQGVNQTFLVVEGSYHGNLLTLFGEGGAFWHNTLFYADGRDWEHYGTYIPGNDPEKDTFFLLFFIRKDDPGPYVIHNDVHDWTVDLSQIPQPNRSYPKESQIEG